MRPVVLALMFGISGWSSAVAISGIAANFVFSPVTANASESESKDSLIVTVDRAKIFRISRPARTVIIGNPSIADATVEDERTLVLTGRSFGVTNIIILDEKGDLIVDRTIVVRGHEANTVRVYRRASRETYACAPICEPTLTIGDNQETFTFANEQIRARNALNEENSTPAEQN
jgi:hypothetical protein